SAPASARHVRTGRVSRARASVSVDVPSALAGPGLERERADGPRAVFSPLCAQGPGAALRCRSRRQIDDVARRLAAEICTAAVLRLPAQSALEAQESSDRDPGAASS